MATPRLDKLVLEAADGGPLRLDVRTGARAGEIRPAVVVCHGFKGFKDWGFFPKLSERLAVAGFTVVSFNFSGSGVSAGDQFDELDRWRRQRPSVDLGDIEIVVDYLAAGGRTAVGIVGHSRGGGLGIIHAAGDPRIKALVTWAAVDHFLRWPEDVVEQWRASGTVDVVNQRTGQVLTLGPDALEDWDRHHAGLLDVLAAAGRLTKPWLLVHGTSDATVPVAVAQQLKQRAAPPGPEMLLIEGGDHVFGARHPWAGSTPQLDRAMQRTVSFLAQHLG